MGTNPTETITRAYDQIRAFMQQEVAMMREILANLHEEELSLLAGDQAGWAKAMQHRSDMIIELGTLRASRHNAIKQLEELTSQRLKRKHVTIDDLLPVQDTNSSEIRSLLDQVIALVDRLNLQNSRNDYLFYQAKTLTKMPLQCEYPHPQQQARTARRKITVTTE